MGVPGFIFWLQTKILDAMKRNSRNDMTVLLPIPSNDILVEKVIGKQIDNFYIDLNGLIHPCCHPQVGTPPKDEDEMLSRIIDEILLLARTVKPTNLFYIAVDGVAPAAKQEQQRQRRFVSVVENSSRGIYLSKLQEKHGAFVDSKKDASKTNKDEMKDVNETPKDSKESNDEEKIQNRQALFDAYLEDKKKHWDHNVISPGTPFMCKCMETVHRAASLIVSEFPHMTVIVSDSSVPGEGEHKILSYMKKERAMHPETFSEMVHVVHGLDADLIMLTSLVGLPHIYSFRDREDARASKRVKELFDIAALGRVFSSAIVGCIHMLDKSHVTKKIDWKTENLVADVVLLLMSVGNDFLPNVPTLVMHNQAASIILYSYAKYLVQCAENDEAADPSTYYIVEVKDGVSINHAKFIKALAPIDEESVIGLFAKLLISNIRKASLSLSEDIYEDGEILKKMEKAIKYCERKQVDYLWKDIAKQSVSHDEYEVVYTILNEFFMEHDKKTKRKNQKYDNASLLQRSLSFNILESIPPTLILKHKDELENAYYEKKFGDSSLEFRKDLVKEFLRGVHWSFFYYFFNDPPSWNWMFPHHYGPVISDIVKFLPELESQTTIDEIVTFEKNSPLTPYQQLLCILPKPSMPLCLPQSYVEVLNDERLKEFFPENFKRDGNFSGISYKAVSLLPSMDFELARKISAEIDSLLTSEEKKKNQLGKDFVYISKESSLYQKITSSTVPLIDVNDKPLVFSGAVAKVQEGDKPLFTFDPANDLKSSAVAFTYKVPEVDIREGYKNFARTSATKTTLQTPLTNSMTRFAKGLGAFVKESEDMDSLTEKKGHKRQSRNGTRQGNNYEPQHKKKKYDGDDDRVDRRDNYERRNDYRRDDRRDYDRRDSRDYRRDDRRDYDRRDDYRTNDSRRRDYDDDFRRDTVIVSNHLVPDYWKTITARMKKENQLRQRESSMRRKVTHKPRRITLNQHHQITQPRLTRRMNEPTRSKRKTRLKQQLWKPRLKYLNQ